MISCSRCASVVKKVKHLSLLQNLQYLGQWNLSPESLVPKQNKAENRYFIGFEWLMFTYLCKFLESLFYIPTIFYFKFHQEVINQLFYFHEIRFSIETKLIMVIYYSYIFSHYSGTLPNINYREVNQERRKLQ